MGPRHLAQLQNQFRFFLHSGKAASGIQSLGLKADRFTSERLGVYRHAFKARIRGAVALDFPKVKRLLGAKTFEKYLEEMISAYPSPFRSLSEVSVFFPVFLKKNKKMSVAGALAQFEWLKTLVELEPLPKGIIKEISSISSNSVERAILILGPSVQLFSGKWTVHKRDIVRKPTRLVIFMKGGQPQVKSLSLEQFLFLSQVQKSVSLKNIFKNRRLARLGPSKIQEFLASCVRAGVIVGYRTDGDAT